MVARLRKSDYSELSYQNSHYIVSYCSSFPRCTCLASSTHRRLDYLHFRLYPQSCYRHRLTPANTYNTYHFCSGSDQAHFDVKAAGDSVVEVQQPDLISTRIERYPEFAAK